MWPGCLWVLGTTQLIDQSINLGMPKGINQPNKVRLRGVQGGHQIGQLFFVEAGNGLSAAFLLLATLMKGLINKNAYKCTSRAFILDVGLPRMIPEDCHNQPK